MYIYSAMDKVQNFTAEEIYAVLEQRRLDLGLTQNEVSERAFGARSNSALQNMRRGNSPTVDRLKAIADALGLEFYLGPRRSRQSEAIPADVDIIGFSETEPVFFQVKSMNSTIHQYAGVPFHPLCRASSAPPVLFDRDWLDEKGIDPEHCVALLAPDNKMSPTITPMSMVVADTRQPIDRSAITVVALEDRLIIGRPTADSDGKYILTFDGLGQAPMVIGDDHSPFAQVGKIVWTGKSV